MKHLPQSWALTCLEDCAEFNPRRGGEVRQDTQVSFVPMAAVSDVEGSIVSPSVRPYGAVSKGYTQFRDDDVIFAKITPCMENGKIAVARNLKNGIGCGTTEFHVLRPCGNVSSNYLWRYLRQQSFRSDAEMSMTGAVGQRRVPADYLRMQEIPLAPIREQRRILAKINSLTGKSKRARDHLDHLPHLVGKYKQAVLAVYFSALDEGVETKPMSALTRVITSGSRDWSSYYDQGSSVFVLAGNIRPMAFDAQPRRYVDPPLDSADARRSRIERDDLLVTIVGANTGDLCRVPTELNNHFVCQSVALIRLLEPGELALSNSFSIQNGLVPLKSSERSMVKVVHT